MRHLTIRTFVAGVLLGSGVIAPALAGAQAPVGGGCGHSVRIADALLGRCAPTTPPETTINPGDDKVGGGRVPRALTPRAGGASP